MIEKHASGRLGMSDTVRLTIDGKEVLANRGETILQAALKAGIEIPHLCYHPRLKPTGACRLCVVEVEGARTLVASCAAPVADGMVVHTKSDRVIKARKLVLELLLSDHPQDCLTCESAGECLLQKYAYEYGVEGKRFEGERRQLPKIGTPFFEYDPNKCILCGRCVAACDEVRGRGVIDFTNRGFATVIKPPFEMLHIDAGCQLCGECVQVCPVGALTEKSRRFAGRTWETHKTRTVCPYCGVGCEIEVHTKDNRITHITAVEDSPVNHGSLCVKGRFGWSFVNSDERLKKPLVRKGRRFVETTWDEALSLVAERLLEIRDKEGPDAIGFLASAKCTNEDNYLLQKFARSVIGTNNIDHCARL